MALYAFDGTWNKDKPGTERDTNVLKFRSAYRPPDSVVYMQGVGTRFGLAGRVFGGMSGAGGRARLESAWAKLAESFARGDTVIDIVGFSRGAAVALEFAEWAMSKRSGSHALPRPVRFLGLWDTVHSFGLPGNSINIGWHMSLPDNVGKCFHAMALDERRHNFPLTRFSARVADAGQEGRLHEVWFRGVHSDIGGGNRNERLSNIALCWMFSAAARCGVDLSTEISLPREARWERTDLGSRPRSDSEPLPRGPLERPGPHLREAARRLRQEAAQHPPLGSSSRRRRRPRPGQGVRRMTRVRLN